MNSYTVDPRNAGILYAATSNGVFKSSDGGVNWTGMNSGLTTPVVYIVAIDARETSTVYAGTAGGGVFAITLE